MNRQSGVEGWEREEAGRRCGCGVTNACSELFRLDFQDPAFPCDAAWCRFIWRRGRETAVFKRYHPAHRGHLTGQLPFLHQNLPWLPFVLFSLFIL